MGTSLCNLNVYNPDKKEYDPGKEYFVANIVEDWDTILENEHEHDFDRICNLAVSLSKSLDTNIVTTIYFDDDIFELSIYSSGKKKAYYYNEYGRIESKNYSAMVGMLDLDFIAAKAFRYFLKKEMFAGDAISKLSAISGLPFYIEKFMYDHMPDRLIPDKEAVLKEIEAENAKNKKKSKASDTVELLCEIPGIVVDKTIDYEDGKHGVVRVVEPSDGEIDYSHIHCYQITGDKNPSLQKIYDYKLPFEKWAPGEQSRALVNLPGTLAIYNDWECIVHEFYDEDEIAEVESIGAIPEDRYNPIKLHNVNDVLRIQSSKNLMAFDMDYQRLILKSVKGNIITKMIDDEDNLYVITSSNILGFGYSHDFKPKDVVRLYKIPLVKDNTTVFFK